MRVDVDPSDSLPPGAGRSRRVPPVPVVFTFAAGLLLAITHRLGGDMPGVLLRIHAFEQGDLVRLPQWFGGVPNLTYSVLLAPLGAVLGVPLLAALSAASTVAGVLHLGRTVEERPRRTLLVVGAIASALSTLAVGRITYSTGTAFAVWSVVALVPAAHASLSVRRWFAAIALALLSGAASPVAGLFLAMVAVAHLLPSRRLVPAAGLAGSALAAPVAVNLAFPSDGGLALGARAGLAITGLYLAVLVASRSRTVRFTAVLGVLATAAVTLVDTQVTYIVKRLPETFGGPALAATGRRVVSTVVVIVLLGWNLLALRTGMSESGRDERSGRVFAPLVEVLRTLDPQGRVEVVPTALHWETWFVAREFPIARGWERQADADHGALFYADDPIAAEAFAEWLETERVSHVVLGDLELDHAGEGEAALLADPPDYLREVSRADGWVIWEVVLPGE